MAGIRDLWQMLSPVIFSVNLYSPGDQRACIKKEKEEQLIYRPYGQPIKMNLICSLCLPGRSLKQQVDIVKSAHMFDFNHDDLKT